MKEEMSDRNVIIIILATILAIFMLVLTFSQPNINDKNSIQWREVTNINVESGDISNDF